MTPPVQEDGAEDRFVYGTADERALGKEFVSACVEYKDGLLRWKRRPIEHFSNSAVCAKWNSRLTGMEVGSATPRGYVRFSLLKHGKRHYLSVHRVVWLICTGEWPRQHIDHINRIRHDNRIENLRDVAPDVNLRNNGNPRGTGLPGAYRIRRSDKFMSKLRDKQGYVYLGVFDTAEEASAAFQKARAARSLLSKHGA